MATVKDLLSNMITKIHTKMDNVAVTDEDDGKVLGVKNGEITLVESSGGTTEGGVSREEFDQLVEKMTD